MSQLSDIDKKIDWEAFYKRHIKQAKVKGTELIGLCPFHSDTKASFGADLETGMYKCLACGEQGNGTVFLSKILNVDTKEAYKELLKEAGEYKENDYTKPAKKSIKYTIQDYAAEKKLPLDFLKDLEIKNGKLGISIPYMDESGNTITRRQRYHQTSKMRFSWARGSKVCLYGLWKLDKIIEAGRVIIVEGESDTQSLWLHGYPALGAPGASTFNETWAQLLLKVQTVFIHQEPDQGGEAFRQKVLESFAGAGYEGIIKVFTVPGHKDPSDLHISKGDDFGKILDESMSRAQVIDLEDFKTKVDEIIPGAPVRLRRPSGWLVSEDGIRWFNPKTEMTELVCRTPLLLTKRLKSLDTGEEKMEISWLRDKEWQSTTMPRSVIFTARGITQLADKGVTITSENAKRVVGYLSSLEAENFEVLKLTKAVSQMGWYGDKFLPGMSEGIVLDVDQSSQKWTAAYEGRGSLEGWINEIAPFRKNEIFRFLLASSFAAPILKLINHRIFFVHNWGDSRSGKTAALKGALSAWGDPEGLMTTFNSTRVGLERLAGFFNDLPLGIDERQVVGNRQDYIETLVYMLSLGTSKVRGTKGGGLHGMTSWRTIVMTTGEEPLTDLESQGGVYTRALEIFGSPFSDEKQARRMHDLVAENHGLAGPEFVRRLAGSCSGGDLLERHKGIQAELEKKFPEKLGTHISNVAVVTLADQLVSEWFFNGEKESSLEMAGKILDRIANTEDFDLVNRAVDFIQDWLFANIGKFAENCAPPRYGMIKDTAMGETFYVIPTVMRKELSANNMNYQKVMRAMMDNELVEVGVEPSGQKKYAVTKWFEGRPKRLIGIPIEKLSMKDEEPPF